MFILLIGMLGEKMLFTQEAGGDRPTSISTHKKILASLVTCSQFRHVF